MDAQQLGEDTANVWVQSHPSQAEAVRDILMGPFAFKECHSERLPDDIICPQCFQDFISNMETLDESVAEEIKTNGYSWARRWVKGVLD